MFINEQDVGAGEVAEVQAVDLDYIRPALQEAINRHGYKLDQIGVRQLKSAADVHRTVRENINDICDPDTFVEYGSLTIAAQSVDALSKILWKIRLEMAWLQVSACNQLFPDQDVCVVMSYDYMVLVALVCRIIEKDRMFEWQKLRIQLY